MFNNVGKKIKGIALTAFVILLIVSVILAWLISKDFFSKNDSESILLGILVFVLIVAVGVLVSWLIILMTYAFGELVDANQIQVQQNNIIIELLRGEKKTTDHQVSRSETLKYGRHYTNYNGGAMDIPTASNK